MINENYKNKIKESIKNKFSVMGIGESDINELVEVSIASLEEEIEKVKEILKGDDIEQLGFHTHTIKGILLNVGLDEDAKQFQEIKHLVNTKTVDEIKEVTKKRISIFD